jgi:hypothetical protein
MISPYVRLGASLRSLGYGLRVSAAAGSLISVREDASGGEVRVHPLVFLLDECDQQIVTALASGRSLGRMPGLRTLRAHLAELQGAAVFAPALSDDGAASLLALDASLSRRGIRLQPMDNRRTLISWTREGGSLALRVHFGLFDQAQARDELERYALKRGRGRYPLLDRAMHVVFAEVQARHGHRRPVAPTVPDLATMVTPWRPSEMGHMIWQRFFGDLPELPIGWSSEPGPRALRGIRFGSFRSKPQPRIALHPRLGAAWVAQVFVEHVIHHEYCHWRQHCEPLRGEKPHSARFKAWERGYPHFADALAWQRAHLDALLGAAPAPV